MNKFKVGDLVEILPLTDAQKRAYPPTWMKDMDDYIGMITTVERVFPKYPVGWDWKMDTYIGSTGTIEHITPNGYKIKGCGRYSWCDTNLRSTVLYEPY